MLNRFVRWQTINFRNTQRRIPIPNKWGVLSLLLVCYLLFSSFRFIKLNGEWRTFESKQYGYSIAYPAQWYVRGEYAHGRKNKHDLLVDFKNGDALLIPTSITIEIHHRTIPDGTLEDVAEWGLELIDITGGAWFISSPIENRVGIEDYPALIQDYNRRGSSKARNVYLISGEDAYILHLVASSQWENGLEIFDRMLASFYLPGQDFERETNE